MPQHPAALLAEIASVWRTLVEGTAPAIRAQVAQSVVDSAERLASVFYKELMALPSALQFLSHTKVQERLHREMQRWLVSLFQVSDEALFEAYCAQQVAVGAVHARIKLPIELLAVAFHVLGRELRDVLLAAMKTPEDRTLAVHYSMALMSLANGLILSAFVREVERGVRNDEAYRHISFQHDAKFERERQRAALAEWAQRVLMSIPLPHQRRSLTPLGRSEFAQWLNHKGQVMFEGIEDLETVHGAIRHLDEAILPRLAGGTLDDPEFPRLIQELDSRLELIRYVMNDLFDRIASLEAGRDSVTRLLNRRYLHSILAREVDTHIAAARSFSLLLVRVREATSLLFDTAESERRTLLLQQVAAILTDYVKAGDHLFRYSDQDFLAIEVETTDAAVWARAGLLQQKLSLLLATSGRRVDIAVVSFDGHPDYQQMLRRAEFAIAGCGGERDELVRG